MYWLVWLLLCGCFAIRHTSKLLDAASQQHALLAQPTTTAAAAVPNPIQQQSSSSSSTAGNASTAAAAVLASQHSKWPDGYVAVCAVIKDQWPDLRYWIEYHRWEGGWMSHTKQCTSWHLLLLQHSCSFACLARLCCMCQKQWTAPAMILPVTHGKAPEANAHEIKEGRGVACNALSIWDGWMHCAQCLVPSHPSMQDPSVNGMSCCDLIRRWLGVSKFYIYDNNSTLPAMLMLWDYMRAGIVEYEYFLGECMPHAPD
jgi:hypothetical protein